MMTLEFLTRAEQDHSIWTYDKANPELVYDVLTAIGRLWRLPPSKEVVEMQKKLTGELQPIVSVVGEIVAACFDAGSWLEYAAYAVEALNSECAADDDSPTYAILDLLTKLDEGICAFAAAKSLDPKIDPEIWRRMEVCIDFVEAMAHVFRLVAGWPRAVSCDWNQNLERESQELYRSIVMLQIIVADYDIWKDAPDCLPAYCTPAQLGLRI